MNFTENLRALREKKGMTQEQLAEQMEVSRQTVSKWESGVSLPEMEKMIQLTELFGCTMDGLLKGNMKQEDQDEAGLYEAHGNRVAAMGAAATCTCILSFAAQGAAEFVNPMFLGESGICFLLFALVGTLLWVRLGMDAVHFREKHPYIEPFYTETQKEEFRRKYVSYMIWGIGLLIAAVIVMAALGTLWPEAANGEDPSAMLYAARVENLSTALFFALAAVGVTPIVYIALQASKYNVEGYNKENIWDNSEEGKENGRIIRKACAIIMMAAVGVCVVVFVITNDGRISGCPLVIGGILCGAARVFLNKRKD